MKLAISIAIILFIFFSGSFVCAQSYGICQNPQTGKWGICYADSIRVPQEYDFAQYISSKEFIVAKNGKWGTITNWGGKVIDMIYDRIWEFARVPNSLLVKQGNKYGIVNYRGKVIVPLYELELDPHLVFQIDEHLSFSFKNHTYQARDKGKMAIYNMEGKKLFDFIYPYIQDIEVPDKDSTKPHHYIYIVGEPGKYYFIDQKNKRIFNNLEVQNMFNVYHDSGHEYKVVELNGEEHLLNVKTGEIMNNEEMSEFLEPFTVVQGLDDKMGAIGNNGKLRIPCIYDNITELNDVEYAIYEVGNKKGLMDYDGKILIEAKYEIIAEVCYNGMNPTEFAYEVYDGNWFALFKYDKSTGTMKPFTPFMYEDITCWEVNKEGLKAYLTDSAGKKSVLMPDFKIQPAK